jgi:hypothetical protein
MKTVLPLIILGLSLPAFSSRLAADTQSDLEALMDRPVGGDPVGKDPDAVPKAFEPKPQQMTPAMRAMRIESLKKAAASKDWLVRAYEQQIQARASGKQNDGDNHNLYAELSGDKDLAKIAGIDPEDFTPTPDLIDYHADTHGGKSDAQLRDDPVAQAAASPPLAPSKSFFPSSSFLEETRAAAPYAAPSPIFSPDNGPFSLSIAPDERDAEPAPQLHLRPADPGALDIPGLTAEEDNPALRDHPELNSDDLTGQDHHLTLTTPAASLETPPTTDLENVQRLHQAALLPPGQTPKKPVVVEAPKVPAPSDTEQMVPDPGTQRSHVDDPFDILR